MKSTKKNTTPKRVKRKGRYSSFDELPEEVKKALKNATITYTVETVGEFIHPDVKKRLEEQRKNQQG
jgi:hypothetical protein